MQRTPAPPAQLRGHTSTIIGLDWSPTEPILASCGWDGTMRLWSVETGACLCMLHAPGPYEGMNPAGVTGMSDAQKTALKALGAIAEIATIVEPLAHAAAQHQGILPGCVSPPASILPPGTRQMRRRLRVTATT
jgi:hypothetical protein